MGNHCGKNCSGGASKLENIHKLEGDDKINGLKNCGLKCVQHRHVGRGVWI